MQEALPVAVSFVSLKNEMWYNRTVSDLPEHSLWQTQKGWMSNVGLQQYFYQIYPIGFCGAPVHNDGVCVPRIRKLMDWSEYLQTLGVDSILLNPIFESDNHGYDTRDFKKIDCRLGTNEDFKEVCEDLHKHNVKIVLDGVFNHVGRGFWAFKDVQEKKWDSPIQGLVPYQFLTETAVTMTVSGMKDGKVILNWSN